MRLVTPFIDGHWLPAGHRVQEDVLNPATRTPVARLAHATAEDLDAALAAARRGFERWRSTPAVQRSALVQRAAALYRERRDHVAMLITEEQGKPLAEARAEVDAAADMLHWLAEEGRRTHGRVLPERAGTMQMAVKEPIGPSLALTPWNFPAISPARKIGGALSAGCSLIIKPSEEVPSACVEMVKAFDDAGLPPGVLGMVCGQPAVISETLISSPIVRKVSFTGSVPVGRHLAGLCARGPKPATMELGGHAPVIVFDDADPLAAADASAAMKFRNAGQICTSPTRFIVHERRFEDFVARLTQRADEMRVGSGIDAATTMGPLINERRLRALHVLVEDACSRGAVRRTRREAVDGAGFYFPPTVLTDVPADARLFDEEPFGPLAIVQPFSSFDEAIGIANGLPYGLAGYAFTASMHTADAVAAALEVGAVGINTFAVTSPEAPFGGVKDSGYGREGGYEGVDAFLVTKFVARAYG